MRLEYSIATTGQDQLRSVLRGVEREAMASDKRLAGARRTSARGVAREQGGLMHGPGRREQMAAIRQTERAQVTATARSMRQQAAAERQRHRLAQANTKTEERAKIQGERNLARARESLDRQRAAALFQQHKNTEQETLRSQVSRRRTAERIGGGAARSVRGSLGTVARVGGAAIGLAGGFAAAGALAERSDVQRRASALANQAGDPGLKGRLADEAGSVQGFTGSETLGAMGAFVGKTGDLDAARASIQGIGKLSLATSSDFETMGEAAGNAFNVIADSIEDPKKRIAALNKVMAGWAGQGNIGTVEMKDMAQFGGRLGGATRKFVGGPADLLLKMGAMAQAAARAGGASDSAEATTGVARFAADLTKKPAQKALKAMGIDVFGGPGAVGSKTHESKLKSPDVVLADILDKTKGSLTLGEDVMNAESGKVLGGFSNIYTSAEAKKKGSGRAAVMGEFERYNRAGLTEKTIAEQANSRMDDPDMQLKEATKVFNDAVGRELAPVSVQLAHQFAELVPIAATLARVVGKFIGFMVENPMAGVGLLVGAALVKDITSAGVGEMLKKAMGVLSDGPGDSTGKPGGNSIAGSASATFMGATVGFAAAVAIFSAGVASFEDGETKARAGGADVVRMRDLAAKSKTGELTPEEQKEVRDIQVRRGKAETDARAAGPGEQAIATVLGIGQKLMAIPSMGASTMIDAKPEDVARTLARPDASNQINTQQSFAKETDALRQAIEANTAAVARAAKIGGPGVPAPEASRVAPMISGSRG